MKRLNCMSWWLFKPTILHNLKELIPFYQLAPVAGARYQRNEQDVTLFFAMHLLIFAKTAVRNYSIAITETATPQLRDLLQKQLNQAIKLHGDVYYFMYNKGMYPSYDLNLMLQADQKNAAAALKL
jgi:spore coat protein F